MKLKFILNRSCYLLSSLICNGSLLALNMWVIYLTFTHANVNIFINIILCVVIFIVLVIIQMLITLATFLESDPEPFISSYKNIFDTKKIIHNSKFGYFLSFIHDEEFTLYEQKAFFIKEVFSISIYIDKDIILDKMNKELDRINDEKMNKISNRNKIKEAKRKIIEWDALDVKTRRDIKIHKVLK